MLFKANPENQQLSYSLCLYTKDIQAQYGIVADHLCFVETNMQCLFQLYT